MKNYFKISKVANYPFKIYGIIDLLSIVLNVAIFLRLHTVQHILNKVHQCRTFRIVL